MESLLNYSLNSSNDDIDDTDINDSGNKLFSIVNYTVSDDEDENEDSINTKKEEEEEEKTNTDNTLVNIQNNNTLNGTNDDIINSDHFNEYDTFEMDWEDRKPNKYQNKINKNKEEDDDKHINTSSSSSNRKKILSSPVAPSEKINQDILEEATIKLKLLGQIFLKQNTPGIYTRQANLSIENIDTTRTVNKLGKIMKRRTKKPNQNFNKKLKKNRAFRNPTILEKLAQSVGIVENGTNFDYLSYYPFRFHPSEYIDGINKELKEMQKKVELEQKNRTQVTFVSPVQQINRSLSNPNINTIHTTNNNNTNSTNNNNNNNNNNNDNNKVKKKRRSKWDQKVKA